MSEPYYPSNGTEGDIFQAQWCENCQHDRAVWGNPDDPDWDNGCPILAQSFIVPQKEWIYDDDDRPCCTAFRHWKDPVIEPPLPGQMVLFG